MKAPVSESATRKALSRQPKKCHFGNQKPKSSKTETPPTNTQRMNTYVTSMKMFYEERTSKNVITPPHTETPPTNTQRMNTYVTSMKMFHEERTSKNVITPPPPPPETPPTNTQRMNTYVTSMKMIHEERTSKNVITPPSRPTTPQKPPEPTPSV